MSLHRTKFPDFFSKANDFHCSVSNTNPKERTNLAHQVNTILTGTTAKLLVWLSDGCFLQQDTFPAELRS